LNNELTPSHESLRKSYTELHQCRQHFQDRETKHMSS